VPQVLQKPKAFCETFFRKPGRQDTTHYCPGCGHGILHKLVAEAISDLEIQDQCILMAPVGCSVFLYYYFECASISVPHGRAPAVATGIGRCRPDAILVCYQGDGDLAAIGTNNAIHAANRGEKIITIFVNNNVYGMTGGQMAPTTLPDQKTTTTPYGRSVREEGPPLRMAEIMATLEAPVLVARTAVNSPKNIRQTRRLLRRGFEAVRDDKGYVFIEVLSPCPTNWRMSPVEAGRWVDEVVTKYFPLGVFKDEVEQRTPAPRERTPRPYTDLVRELGLSTGADDDETPPPLPGGRTALRFKGAGFGGQGVLRLGLLVGEAGMDKGWHVTWLPSYGPEMRGGVAYSSVVLSDRLIGSPVVDTPDILVTLNRPSLLRLAGTVAEGGVLIYNTSMSDEVPETPAGTVFGLPASDMAREAGDLRATNTVALGAAARLSGLFTLDELDRVLSRTFTKPAVAEINRKAVRMGWDAAAKAPRQKAGS